MTIKIANIRGIVAEHVDSLRGHGIADSDALLAAARTPAQRKELAGKLGITPKQVLEYANRADLARVKGIGGVIGNLLEDIGVDTVAELAGRNAESLQAKLAATAQERGLTFRASVDAVADWVAQAKALGRGLEY